MRRPPSAKACAQWRAEELEQGASACSRPWEAVSFRAVLLALTEGHKIGLALAAAAFIAFALASALWIPRLRPDFPGCGLRLFMLVTVAVTIGMLAAVIALAGESKETEAAPGTTEATVPTPPSPQPSGPAPAPAGDAAAGKAVFASQGCASCHTFTPAGAKGTIGPNLDNLAADATKANRGTLQQYAVESIEKPTAYAAPGFPQGTMPPFNLSAKQLADLVAFLTQK